MITKVIIKRQVTKGKEQDFFNVLKEMRIHAMDQKGYITGETLIGTKDQNKVVVISKWESPEDWDAWQNSDQKKTINAKMEKLLDEPTRYESFVFSKFWAAASQGFPPPLQKLGELDPQS